MINVDIRYSFKKYEDRLKTYKRELVLAAVQGMNRAAASGRAHAAREMRDMYGSLNVGKIKARMRLKKATRTAPSAEIRFSGRRISLMNNFGMRAMGKFGVAFRKLPWRMETADGKEVSSDMLDRAFRQRGPGGRAGVFARAGVKRYPIELLLASSVAQALKEQGIKTKIISKLHARYHEVFTHEMKRRLAAAR